MGLQIFGLIGHDVDDGMGGSGIDFGRVGCFKPGNVSGKFYRSQLHAKAKTKIGDFMLTGVLGGQNFAFGAPRAPALGKNDGGGIDVG